MKYSIRLVNKTSGMLWWKKTKKVYQIACEKVVVDFDYFLGVVYDTKCEVVSEVDTLEEAKVELALWKINEV